MIVEKFDIGYDIKKIYHIADIHIRNLKRHKEYKAQFNKLYKIISQDTKNAVCVIAGDIVHAKTEMSPELISMTENLLGSLANIMPTIIIAGNHDCNLNNKSRLDALSPIVDALKNKGLFYLRDTGSYSFGDTDFVVMSVFDGVKDYPTSKISKAKNKIALYHGPIENSTTDVGYRLVNYDMNVGSFKGFDLVLLGDIHKRQFLNGPETIAYPGSFIQQNHGENFDNHGILVWDVEKRKSKYIHVDNDYGYYTLKVKDGKLPDLSKVPKFPRLRVQFEKTAVADTQTIIVELKRRFNVQDIVVNKLDRLSQVKFGDKSVMSAIGEVRDQNYQNKLIGDYIDRNYEGVNSEILKNIRDVNKEVNNKIGGIKISRNIIWKPKTFEFSNMFSYGGNNKIDFQNMTGLHGIFAPNHSGKSAFLDAISYCCFDKCSRTKTGSSVLNNKKSRFYCKLNFEIDGSDYFIERKASKQKSGHVRVDVNFWMTGEGGEAISLNGEQRKDTNANIRGYIGTYEDFELTCLSVQNDNTGFIDKSQSERKDCLAQFLDLDIFEELFQTANEDMKDVNALLKEFQKQDFATTLADSKNALEALTNKYDELKLEKEGITKKRQKIEKLILDNTKKLHKIDSSIVDIKALKSDEKVQQKSKSDLAKLAEGIKNKAATLYKRSKVENKRLSKYDEIKLNSELKDLNDIREKKELLEKAILSLKNKVEVKMSKIEVLEGLNPDCEFCMTNNIIKDAKTVEQELIEDKKYARKLVNNKKQFIAKINGFNGVEKELNTVERLKENIRTFDLEISQFKDKHNIAKGKKALVIKTLNDTKKKIENYHNNINFIKENKITQNRIDKYSDNLAEVKLSIEALTDEVTKYYGKINVVKNTISSIKKSIRNIKELEAKYQAYEFYLDAVSRNGIPYELISLVMPMVQDEINNILSQIVDFGIIFEVDGKNINTYIKYDDNNIWGLELTSGMEKFIASLAIRSSLINISNLPRPTFIAIDEGFGNLDSDNLNSIFMFFNYLKSQFDFVFIISHLDVMRDVVDQLIEIKVENGHSQIKY